MLAFSTEVISAFGFDWTRGRQDKSTHPFAAPIGSDDVRITTRFDNRHPFEMLFAAMHETGHALYEQGVSPAWARTLVCGGASQGVHESQSRMWENVIGRSRPFWQHFFPLLQQRFPSQLGGVTLEQFYRGINQVKPSLIRVEADEVTYNLHVMLRVEIEIALLDRRDFHRRMRRPTGTRKSRNTSVSCPIPMRTASCRICTGRSASSVTSRPIRLEI